MWYKNIFNLLIYYLLNFLDDFLFLTPKYLSMSSSSSSLKSPSLLLFFFSPDSFISYTNQNTTNHVCRKSIIKSHENRIVSNNNHSSYIFSCIPNLTFIMKKRNGQRIKVSLKHKVNAKVHLVCWSFGLTNAFFQKQNFRFLCRILR